jgi:hypothetical protein
MISQVSIKPKFNIEIEEERYVWDIRKYPRDLERVGKFQLVDFQRVLRKWQILKGLRIVQNQNENSASDSGQFSKA